MSYRLSLCSLFKSGGFIFHQGMRLWKFRNIRSSSQRRRNLHLPSRYMNEIIQKLTAFNSFVIFPLKNKILHFSWSSSNTFLRTCLFQIAQHTTQTRRTAYVGWGRGWSGDTATRRCACAMRRGFMND